MMINPTLRLRPPAPARRTWHRPVESAGAGAATSRFAPSDHELASASASFAIEAGARLAEAAAFVDTAPLAPATLAGLNALRAADAEVAAPALLAAAKAHGRIDHAHLKVILAHLDEVGASQEDRRYVLAHLTDPPDDREMLSRVHDRATAQETYSIAALMIDPEQPKERAWLAELQLRLREIAARFS
jgi:uncharacterized membrane protein YebE (DUF533 family)